MNWQEYQDQAANLFRALGLQAVTNKTLRGVRTTHKVDVLVTSTQFGFPLNWIIECKYWKEPVCKLHILALREIVADTGVDRGFVLSESGFQSGAIEASSLTNITLTSISRIAALAEEAIYLMRLKDLSNRIELCNERYWEMPKATRVKNGLRPDSGETGYSSVQVIAIVRDLMGQVFRGRFPFSLETLYTLARPDFPKKFDSAGEVFYIAETLVLDLERRLDTAVIQDK